VCIISDRLRFVHPPYSHRILYAGQNLALLKYLQDELKDCLIVRCAGDSTARAFIKSINYSLLLFDEVLPDAMGRELAAFVGALANRAGTPVIIFKKTDNFEPLANAISHFLTGQA
jgi:DNA-binding response OmpR family regulator